MDEFNGFLSIAAAAALSFVVLSSRVDEGAWIKLGLIAMIFSLIVSALYSFFDLPLKTAYNAAFVLRGGIVVVCIGYYMKFKRHKRDGVPTDFQNLTER
jgi:hypothetical protein